jgi:hypothetical protein
MNITLETIVVSIIAVIVLVLIIFIFNEQISEFFGVFENFMKSIFSFTELNVTGAMQ